MIDSKLAHDLALLAPTSRRTNNDGFLLAAVLAVIVRAADRLPKGCSARRALAEAAEPVRDALEAVPVTRGGERWAPAFARRASTACGDAEDARPR